MNSQEELIAKLIFFPALRAESLCFFLVQACPRSLQRPHLFLFSQNAFFLCASRGVFPNEGLSHHVSRLKTVFFPCASRGVCFFSPDASFPTNRMALPGLPHEQICSTWASSRTQLFYLGFPTNRSCLPELPHEQNYSTWVSPRTELQVANLFLEVILFVGKPR